MRWQVLTWLGWAGLTLSPALAFSLPRPLDNMYQEVVRFYKRVRHEGGQYNCLGEYNSYADFVSDLSYKSRSHLSAPEFVWVVRNPAEQLWQGSSAK